MYAMLVKIFSGILFRDNTKKIDTTVSKTYPHKQY